MSISIQAEGRRLYVTGNTFPIKGDIRAAGGKWDADRKAWWIGVTKRADIEAAIASAQPKQSAAAKPEREAPGEDATVAGRCEYKGKTYYLAGRIERGRTHYDDRVDAVTTRDGAKFLLYSRDGALQFWADRALVSVTKTYDRPQRIGGLKRYAERAKQAGGGQLESGYYYADNGEVLASGCSECRRLGTMCRSCQHDYE